MIKSYLITSSDFYTDTRHLFRERLQTQLQKHRVDFALFRDKTTQNYARVAEDFLESCRLFGVEGAFLHRDIELALKLGAKGVHLSSDMFDTIEYAKEQGLEVIVSTHSYEDILLAQSRGADYVTYSPIFASPNKGKPKGVEDLKNILQKVDIKLFALGGILTQEHVSAVEQSGAFGFASIRYFY